MSLCFLYARTFEVVVVLSVAMLRRTILLSEKSLSTFILGMMFESAIIDDKVKNIGQPVCRFDNLVDQIEAV